MPAKRKPASIPVQLLDLFLMELTNWRWSWQSMVLTSTITPILGIIALGSFATASGQESLAYIFTGNIVMSLMFGNLDKIASRFSYMRFAGTLDYYATLPIRKLVLIMAIVLAFFLLSCPSLLVVLGFGAFFLKVNLIVNPLILLVIPLCVLPLAGVGALIGTNARTPEQSGSFSLLVTMVMLFIGPVLIPETRLPDFLVAVGHFSPATYAASALRQTLLTPITGEIWVDLGVLLGFALLSFWFTLVKLDWRYSS